MFWSKSTTSNRHEHLWDGTDMLQSNFLQVVYSSTSVPSSSSIPHISLKLKIHRCSSCSICSQAEESDFPTIIRVAPKKAVSQHRHWLDVPRKRKAPRRSMFCNGLPRRSSSYVPIYPKRALHKWSIKDNQSCCVRQWQFLFPLRRRRWSSSAVEVTSPDGDGRNLPGCGDSGTGKTQDIEIDCGRVIKKNFGYHPLTVVVDVVDGSFCWWYDFATLQGWGKH